MVMYHLVMILVLMSRELLTKYPQVTKYTTIYMDSLRDGKSQSSKYK